MKHFVNKLSRLVVAIAALAITIPASAQVADGTNEFVAAAKNPASDSLGSGVGRGMAVVQADDPLNPLGKALVAITDYTTHGIHIFEIDPSAGHGLPPTVNKIFSSNSVTSGYSTTPRTVFAGDLDNNGVLEFIVPVGYYTSDSARGLYVFEWNSAANTFGDGSGGPTAIIMPDMIDPAYANNSFGRSEAGLYVGDIDGDGVNELVWGDLVFSFDVAKVYIGSVTGTFQSGFWTYTNEYVDSTMTHALPATSDGYVPFALQRADNLFGDGNTAMIWYGWANVHTGAAMGAIEATGQDTYVSSSILTVDTVKSEFRVKGHGALVPGDVAGVSGNTLFVIKDASSELWAVTGFTTPANLSGATLTRVMGVPSSWNNVRYGDQDHGTGSDGFDLYIPVTSGVADLEWNGTGSITDSASYTMYNIFDIKEQEGYLKYGGAITTIFVTPGMDVDANGHKDILVANKPGGSTADSTAAGYVTSFPGVFLLEWGDSTLITEIKGLTRGTPGIFRLQQNYPNPFNPSTKIDYTLKATGKVSIVVYDLLGREVARLVDGVQAAGEHSVIFKAGDLASGVYVYSLTTADGLKITKKMMLMK